MSLGLDIDPGRGAGFIAKQQMIEIAKAINRESEVLIMDEPTAALTERDRELPLYPDLRARGRDHLAFPPPG